MVSTKGIERPAAAVPASPSERATPQDRTEPAAIDACEGIGRAHLSATALAPKPVPVADPRLRLVGTAQAPALAPWRPNADGVRTIEQAASIARRHGVHIPDDIQLLVNDTHVPDGAEASYALLGAKSAQALIPWKDFYNRFGRIPVRIRSTVLQSDEAIVAVIAHEMHELNSLREIFDQHGGALRAETLHHLITPGIKGNLHDQAWDIADRLVGKMRRATP